MSVFYSAPGKILWIGGYAVLERPNVSFVTGVDKRVYVRVMDGNQICFVSKQFGFDVGAKFENGKIVLDSDVPAAKFIASAAQATLTYLHAKGKHVKPFFLESASDPAFGVTDKAGLGSSAAVVTAAVAAILDFHGVNPLENRTIVFKLAQYAHADAQGGKVGSGFDIAAAAFGASSYIRFSPEFITKHAFPANIEETWDCKVSTVPLPKSFRIVVANIVGQSASTSEMVKQVNAWKASHPDEYNVLMAKLNAANETAIKALEYYYESSDPKALHKFKEAFEEGRTFTRELGDKSGAAVEPFILKQLVDECMKNGAFVAKLPGAGGGDSVAAFCLSETDENRLRAFLSSYKAVKVRPLNLRASNEGIRKETAQDFNKMLATIS